MNFDIFTEADCNTLSAHNKQTSIVFFIHTPKDPTTAVFSNVTRRADYLKHSGHFASVIGPEDFGWLTKIGCKWYTLIYAWAVAWYLIRRRNTIDIAIFHSHSGWLFNLIRGWSKNLGRIRTITQFHGLEPIFFDQLRMESKRLSLRYRLMQGIIANILIRASCRRSDRVHCLNSEERSYLVHNRWAEAERVIQYSNGAPEDFFEPRHYSPQVHRLLFLGQWIERKGTRALVEAFKLTHERSLHLELLCVGTLSDAPTVLRDFPTSLREFVHVVPRVPHSEIKRYLTEADVFLFPSLSEGFGIALMEAMAAGLPIVTTQVGAALDALTNDESALFIPRNSPTEMVNAIEKLVTDSQLRERLGRQAQMKAQNYSWKLVCAQYTESILSIAPVRKKTGRVSLGSEAITNMADRKIHGDRRPKSIVFFIHTPKDPSTSVFNSVARRAEYIQEAGEKAIIVAPGDFGWLEKIGSRWYTLLYALAVAAYLIRRRHSIDIAIFHSHAGWLFHLIRGWSQSLSQIRTVTQFHGLEPLFFNQLRREGKPLSLRYRIMQGLIAGRLIRASTRRSDQIQCLNSEERKYLVVNHWAATERVIEYPNGVAADFFQTRHYRIHAHKLIFLGQWIERKGIRALVEAFRMAHERALNLDLLCVGTLCDRQRVLCDFPESIHSSVRVIPKTPHSEIIRFLMEGDIFVFPTLFEGFSIALIEAMAAGLPIVTTPVAAALDLLTHDVNALFVPVNSPVQLVQAIEKLIGDSALQERLGQAAQLKAREYSWERVGAQYTETLLSISGRRGRGSRLS